MLTKRAIVTSPAGRVLRRLDMSDAEACWIWPGQVQHGYGVIAGQGEDWKRLRVHRVVYEHLVGSIPDGLVLDHLCRVTLCCNPRHLEPVLQSVNAARGQAAKTHCVRGHEFTEENTAIRPNGARRCRACNRNRSREHRQEVSV